MVFKLFVANIFLNYFASKYSFVMQLGMAFEFLRQIIEASPALSFFNFLKFFHNLLFGMTRLFNNFPKIEKFFISNFSIVVLVYNTEEFFSRNFSKWSFPMFNCFLYVNIIRVILIKAIENCSYFILTFFTYLNLVVNNLHLLDSIPFIFIDDIYKCIIILYSYWLRHQDAWSALHPTKQTMNQLYRV